MNPDHVETESLLAHLRDEMKPDDRAALEARLLEDEALRRTFLELSTEEAALTDWAKAERASAKLDDETFSDSQPSNNITSLRGSRPLAGWWAAAAILALSAAGFFFVNHSNSTIAPASGVAHLVASVDAEWHSATPMLNAPLPSGDYQLMSGSIDLLFGDGARVSLSGPAHFDLRSTRHIHLKTGNLVAQIPDEALGFIVTSPQSEVVDLGTEFGLSVDDSGLTDVHVLNGLVEVLPADRINQTATSGIMIGEGEARRFTHDPDANAAEIPISSRASLIGNQPSSQLGLSMLRGSVRVVKNITKDDLFEVSEGPNWIDLIVEQRDVSLSAPLIASIDSPGSYRNFVDLETTISSGRSLNSYLLHFRPNSTSHVSGVIRFDRPIVAILCTGQHLRDTDSQFGVPNVYYPSKGNAFQGLEPNGMLTGGKQTPVQEWEPDEIILSQDRTTISIRTFAGIDRGYDQIRILTEASGDD